MVEIYDSEQEQVDALKRWWKENGKTVAAGLVIGLGGVFGWTAWQEHQRGQAEAASALFQRQADAVQQQSYQEAEQAGAQLLESYPGSGYAPLSAMLLAKTALLLNRAGDARRHLQWVMDNAERRALKLNARLTLARLSLDAKDYDGALALLNEPEPGALASAFDELRGDVLVAQSKPDEAREAYSRALARIAEQPTPERSRMQMKLDDLGHLNVPSG